MNDKLVDALFTRRREAVTRLALCLFVSALLAIAARIPTLFVSLPAAWISGGLSVAFIWVIGPPVLIVLQAYALHGLSEAEQLRRLLRSQSSDDSRDLEGELTPIWRKSFPPVIHLALVLALSAPTIASGALLGSYLQLVRPDKNGRPQYSGQISQMIDAFIGRGGWNGFFPIAPSLQANLQDEEKGAKEEADKAKYRSLETKIPWTYFPVETWAYVFLLLLSLDGAVVGGAYITGSDRFMESFLYRLWSTLSSIFHKSAKAWAKRTLDKKRPTSVKSDRSGETNNG